ncbi:retrotransposon protein, putative, ty1-copia subclass [Tanacetum coccineum]
MKPWDEGGLKDKSKELSSSLCKSTAQKGGKLVLRVEKKMHVIEQPLPPALEAGAEPNIVAQWTALYDAHTEIALETFRLNPIFPCLYKQEEGKSLLTMSLRRKECGCKWNVLDICYQQDISVGLILNGLTKGLLWYLRPAKDDPATNGKKEVGHWKRNCLVYLAELQKKRKQVGSASSLGSKEAKTREPLYFTCKGVSCHKKNQLEVMTIVLPNGLVICLDNCHYAPTITRGVVLVSRLVDNGFVQCFTDYGISVSKNGVLYFNVVSRNGIYEIDMHDLVPNVNSIYNVSNKRVKHNLDSTYLWHCRLAHINKKRIKQLQQDGLLKSTDDESFDKCESCLSGKMTKKPFPHKSATRILNMVQLRSEQNTIMNCGMEKFQHLSYLKVFGCEALVNKGKEKSGGREKEGKGGGKKGRDTQKETMVDYFYIPPDKTKLVVARVECYCDAGFETDRDDTKSQTGYVFVLNGGAVDWKSSKQSTTAMSATESEYIAASKARMEISAVHYANKPGVQKGAKHYQRRYHYVRECVELGEIRILKVHTDNNLGDPFTKALSNRKLTQHARGMGLRPASSFMYICVLVFG